MMEHECTPKSCAGCAGCGSKTHNGGCCGCCGGGELLLCKEEVLLLEELGQLAFLPVLEQQDPKKARYIPVYQNLGLSDDLFSRVIESLLWKKLISLDATLPIANVEYGVSQESSDCLCGSIALTLQGQEALTLLALSGWDQ